MYTSDLEKSKQKKPRTISLVSNDRLFKLSDVSITRNPALEIALTTYSLYFFRDSKFYDLDL